MKKFIRFSLLALVCLLISLLAMGCSVKGNTYVYEKYEIKQESTLNESQRNLLQNEISKYVNSNVEYTFYEDGSFGAFSYWKQSGSKVYVGNGKDFKIEDGTLIGELKGGKLVVPFTFEIGSFKISAEITYIKK